MEVGRFCRSDRCGSELGPARDEPAATDFRGKREATSRTRWRAPPRNRFTGGESTQKAARVGAGRTGQSVWGRGRGRGAVNRDSRRRSTAPTRRRSSFASDRDRSREGGRVERARKSRLGDNTEKGRHQGTRI